MYTLMRGVGTFLLLYFGAPAVNAIVGLFPKALMTALSTVGAFLPAVGIAALLVFLADDIWGVIFFITGFSAFEFLKLNSISIMFFAIVLAYMYYRTMGTPPNVLGGTGDEEVAADKYEEVV